MLTLITIHNACVDVCVQTFLQPALQSACQCCPSISSNLPPICSAANKHFMCHRGPRHTVSLWPPFVLFCCRRRKCATRHRVFRAIALQTTFEARQRSPSDTPSFFVSLAGLLKVLRLIEGFFFSCLTAGRPEGSRVSLGYQRGGLRD